jgi:hypothetical protein
MALLAFGPSITAHQHGMLRSAAPPPRGGNALPVIALQSFERLQFTDMKPPQTAEIDRFC